MISQGLFENFQFSQLTDREKLIYIGLILIADDEGRFKADPHYLRAKLFPYENGNDEMRVSDISRGINKIMALHLADIWQASGEQVGEHPNWKKYQKIRAEIKTPSTIPCKKSAEVDNSIVKLSIDKVSIDIAAKAAPPKKVRKDIEIINLYSTSKGIKFENPTQYSSFIKRNVRAAGLLTGYSLEKIAGVMTYLNKQADFKWTLETVGKYIDENPNKITSFKKAKVLN